MRLLLHGLLYLLALSMSPGVVELADDAGHLLLAGHTEHGERSERGCAEHGCTPSSHHCGCCTSVATAAPPERVAVRRPEGTSHTWAPAVSTPGPDGVRVVLERPPTA